MNLISKFYADRYGFGFAHSDLSEPGITRYRYWLKFSREGIEYRIVVKEVIATHTLHGGLIWS